MQNDRDKAFTPPGTSDTAAAAGQRRAAGSQSSGGGQDRPTGLGGSATDGQHGAGTRAKEAASQVGHRALDEVESRVEQRKGRAADSLEEVARSLRAASDQMPGDDGIGRYIQRAATQVDHLASFLDNHEVAEFIDDVEHFARRQPGAFVSGAFALGLVGARFMKSSRGQAVEEGVRDRWSSERLTSRIEDPTRDAVSRPSAPGYAPPEDRRDDEFGSPGTSY